MRVFHYSLTRWDEVAKAHGGYDHKNGGFHGCCRRAMRKEVTSCLGVAECALLLAALLNNGTPQPLLGKIIQSGFANSQSEEGNARGEGVLPYMGYIGMCRCEGYGFQADYFSIGYINQSIWV